MENRYYDEPEARPIALNYLMRLFTYLQADGWVEWIWQLRSQII